MMASFHIMHIMLPVVSNKEISDLHRTNCLAMLHNISSTITQSKFDEQLIYFKVHPLFLSLGKNEMQ